MTAANGDPFVRALAQVSGKPVIEGFVLDEVLGDGAQSRVWGAHDEHGHAVAVKMLIDPTPEARARLEREAAALARIGAHPSVVKFARLARDARGEPCLVLERVEGVTLEAAIRRDGPVSPREAARIGAEVARGLGLTHSRGVVHRDVKPANVILERVTGRAVLIDFGVASMREATPLTRLGARPGTAAYMPPERLRGDEAGALMDIYSLGVLLYECVTGSRPWEGTGAYERGARDPWADPPAAARDKVRTVPSRLRRIIVACLAVDPGRRPPDGAVVADALERFRAETPASRALRAGRLAIALIATSIVAPVRAGRPERPVPAAAVDAVKAGRERLSAGDAAGALAATDVAIALAPDHAEAWVLRAAARLGRDDPQGAVREANQALLLKRGAPRALVLRARARLAIDDARGAIEDCAAALAVEPEHAEAFKVRGMAEYALARKDVGDMRRARASLTRAIELDPTDAETYCVRGFARHFLGDPRGAIDDHTRALELRPGSTRALLNRGAVRCELGDHAGAVADLDRVVAVDPYALLYRGRAKLGLRDDAGALADWRAFAAQFPDTQDARQLAPELEALERRLEPAR